MNPILKAAIGSAIGGVLAFLIIEKVIKAQP